MKISKLMLVGFLAVFVAVGNVAAQNGAISGTVFNDGNSNGVADPGESVEAGATVRLLGEDENGNTIVIATATTNAQGGYTFTGIPAGNYQLEFFYPSSGLTVRTNVFPLGANQNYNFNAPVIEDTASLGTTYTNLSLANSGATRGPGVSPFTPPSPPGG